VAFSEEPGYPKPPPADLASQMAGIRHDAERLQLVERSFKTVLEADTHQDAKAGRILAAIAFLTAATVALFNNRHSPLLSTAELRQVLSDQLDPIVQPADLPTALDTLEQTLGQNFQLIVGFDMALWAFVVYIFCVLLGAGLYLYAIGPSFNVPFWFKHHRSLLFFKFIAGYSREDWNKEWSVSSTVSIRQIMINNYITETYLIARKTQYKVFLMSVGSFLFRFALMAFVPLAVGLLEFDPSTKKLLVCAGLGAFFAAYIFANIFKTSRRLIDWLWMTLWVLALIGLLIWALYP
jgi:hypothetical protein